MIILNFKDPKYNEFSGQLKPPKTIENPIYKMTGHINNKGFLIYEFESIKHRIGKQEQRKKENILFISRQ